MNEISSRIVTSHKEAAKRAIAYLARTRNLKMASAEALELVSCVLGAANWQTLLAQANQGKGPRIDDGSGLFAIAALPAPQPAPVASRLTDAQRLGDYFGTDTTWGEHPGHPRSGWEHEVENGDTGAAYWDYVVSEIEYKHEMFPWERDESIDVQLALLAGWDVEYNRSVNIQGRSEQYSAWSAMKVGEQGPYTEGDDSEEESWQLAAIEVKKDICAALGMEDAQWRALSYENKLHTFHSAEIIRTQAAKAAEPEKSPELNRSPEILQEVIACPQDELPNDGYCLLPGEMTKDSRKFSEAVGICREAGVKAVFSDEREEEGLYWCLSLTVKHLDDGLGFCGVYPTEDEAWEAAAAVLKQKTK